MRRLLPLLLLVLIPAPSVAFADGCPPSTCGATSWAEPGSSLLLLRPGGQTGPLQVNDVRTGRRQFTLPAGVLSADGKSFLAATVPKATTVRTSVVRYDARSGKVVRKWSVPRNWSAGALSADGRRWALIRYRRRGIVLRVGASQMALRGMYDVEALSPDGRKVFLFHWKRSGGYDLQQLDFATQKLTPTRLDEPDEKMTGLATTAVATRDGNWLLTLYVKPDQHTFIHALDLQTGVAHCIDLPLLEDFTTAGALALSPDETKLYIAGGYTGRVATVDLAKLDVSRVTRFRAPSRYEVNMLVGPSSAVTPNGRMLAFSAGKFVWLYDTAFGVVRARASFNTPVTGLGFRPDGRRLLVLQRHGPAVFLDAATGSRL